MSSPPDPGSHRPAPGRRRGGRRDRLRRWVRRPLVAVALLATAVAVSVAEGQPSTTERPSGVSIPDPDGAPGAVGTLLVVADGTLIRYDTASGRGRAVPLPRGVTALRAWTQQGRDLVLGRLPTGRTAAYLLGGPPVALGPAEVAVPSVDGTAVWLAVRRTATRVPLAGGARRTVPLPRGARLVGDTRAGLVVSTGTVPDPLLPGHRPTPTLTPGGTSAVASPTPPGGTVTPGATPPAGGAPTAGTAATAGRGSPAVTGPTVPPTTPPYTTASPVPSTGPGGVPLTTLVVANSGAVRFLAPAEAVAAAGDVVLVRDAERRLGVVSPRPGLRTPRLLPRLSALEVIGPGTLDQHGETFAVLARVNDYARLMVGPTAARTESQILVVPLSGGPPRPDAAPPAFTASGRVLVTRPDGRIVYYTPGERRGFVLTDDLPPASAVSQA